MPLTLRLPSRQRLRRLSWRFLLAAGGLALLWVFAWNDGFGHAFYPTRRSLGLAGVAWLVLTLALWVVLPACGRVMGRLPRRERALYVLLSLGLGAMMLTFLPHPNERAQIVPHRLQITPLNQPDCRPVTLLGFETEQGEVSYATFGAATFGPLEGWERKDNHLFSQAVAGPVQAGPLNWRGFTRDAKLTFQGGPGACPVAVNWDGRAVTYPLEGPEARPVYVHDALVQPLPVRALALLAQLAVTGGLVLSAILALVWAWGRVAPYGAAAAGEQPPAHWLWVLAPALISVVIFAVASQRFGLLLSTDTSSYVSAARSLAAGSGYIQANGDTYDWWPPLYPFLLAGGYWLKGQGAPFAPDPFQFARWLNMACYGLTLCGWGLLLRRLVPGLRPPLAAGLVLLVGLSPALYQSDAYLLSEPVFLLAITGWLVFFERYLRRGAVVDVVLLAVCAGLAALGRYVGVLIIGLAALGVLAAHLLADRSLAAWPRRRFNLVRAGLLLGQVTLVGLLAALPLGVWVYRNYVITGGPFGLRTPALIPLDENTRAALLAVAGFFGVQPVGQPGPLAWTGCALVTVLIFAGLAGLAVLARQDLRRCQALPSETFLALTLAGLAVGYSVLLVVFLSINANSPIGIRYMSPAYLPLALLLVYTGHRLVGERSAAGWLSPADKLSAASRFSAAGALGWGVSGLLGLGLVWAGGVNLLQTASTPVLAEADRLSIYALRHNQVLDYVRRHRFEDRQVVYSNCPRCLIFFAEVYDARIFDELPANQTYLPKPGQDFTLVWFNGVNASPLDLPEGSYTHPLPDLGALLGRPVKPEALFDCKDGVVAQVQQP